MQQKLRILKLIYLPQEQEKYLKQSNFKLRKNNPTLHLKEKEKQNPKLVEKIKLQKSKKKKIEAKKIEKINETNSQFFEKIKSD